MGTIWFWLVGLMLVAYVVLDGFDIGAGVVHLFVARTDEERGIILRTIGPVWDGNEVWLLAAGGTLYFAFPPLYASAFSGFYLPLMIVLWLLVFRGIGIELRMHIDLQIWRQFFDGCFSFASILLAIFFGAALANVIRGVPLDADGYFFLPLWTNWRPGPQPGILDWYTVIGGLVALAALTLHGTLWIALKTEGPLRRRSVRVATAMIGIVTILTVVSLIATIQVRPSTLVNYERYPIAFLIPAVVVASIFGVYWFVRRERDTEAFLCSASYLSAMLIGAAFGLYPALLPSSTDPARAITIANAASGQYALSAGLVWWTLGLTLAVGYFVFIFRMFRGRVTSAAHHS